MRRVWGTSSRWPRGFFVTSFQSKSLCRHAQGDVSGAPLPNDLVAFPSVFADMLNATCLGQLFPMTSCSFLRWRSKPSQVLPSISLYILLAGLASVDCVYTIFKMLFLQLVHSLSCGTVQYLSFLSITPMGIMYQRFVFWHKLTLTLRGVVQSTYAQGPHGQSASCQKQDHHSGLQCHCALH